MNLTIPIRATNSKSSLTRDMGGYSSVGRSSANVWKNTKSDQKRFILSIVTVGLLVSTLVVGSVGGVMQSASAKENTWYGQGSQNNDNNSRNGQTYSNANRNDTQPTNTAGGSTTSRPTTQTPVTTTPTNTVTPAAPAPATPAVTQPAPTPAPVATPARTATPQIAAQPSVVETSAPVDTAPAIANMAEAQATTSSESVTYTSERMSDATRNRLMILAGVAAVTGGLLYTMSFIGATSASQKRGIPIRYIVPVREAASY